MLAVFWGVRVTFSPYVFSFLVGRLEDVGENLGVFYAVDLGSASAHALDFKVAVAGLRRLDIDVPWRRLGRGFWWSLCWRGLGRLGYDALSLDWGVEGLSVRRHLGYCISLGYLGLGRLVKILEIDDDLRFLRILVWTHSESLRAVHAGNCHAFLDWLSVNLFLP